LRIQIFPEELGSFSAFQHFPISTRVPKQSLEIPPCNPQQEKIQSVCASGKTSDRERGEEDSLHSSIPLLFA
jgi:hypothetical protein